MKIGKTIIRFPNESEYRGRRPQVIICPASILGNIILILLLKVFPIVAGIWMGATAYHEGAGILSLVIPVCIISWVVVNTAQEIKWAKGIRG